MSEGQEKDLGQHLARIEVLVQELEEMASAQASGAAQELVRTLLHMHRQGISRLLELLKDVSGRQGLVACCERDAFLSGLLLLHGLHPLDVETRVRRALERIRPGLGDIGADIELVSVKGGIVRLKLVEGGLPVPRVLRTVLEEILAEAAPDAERIEWEGWMEPGTGLMSLPVIRLES